jgi:formate hydrogenlyase transcriptional activator
VSPSSSGSSQSGPHAPPEKITDAVFGQSAPSDLKNSFSHAAFEKPVPDNLFSFATPEALLNSEALLCAYFKVAKVGIAILDTNLRYVAINHTLAEMNRIPAEDHIGKSIRELLPGVAEAIGPQLERVLATGEPIPNLEVSCPYPDNSGPSHWIDYLFPIKNEAGEIQHIGGFVVEITQQKRLEESLRTTSDKLREEKKRQQIMLELTRLLAEKWDPDRTFLQLSAFLRRVLRQEYAALALRDRDSGALVRQAIDFPLGKNQEAGEEISAVSGARALQERSPVILNSSDVQASTPGITSSLASEGIKSLCCVPLLRSSDSMGVLVLGSTRAKAFNDEDLKLLSQVATQLTIAIENARIADEVQQLKRRLDHEKSYLEGQVPFTLQYEEIVGQSPALQRVLAHATVVAPSDATVLILGETGTGKGLIAQLIHRASARKDNNFVTLNCAAIPTGLLESELFGHEKGAFTSAITQKIGRLELANGGTLFLDEIGDIPTELQPKLLRVLQDHEFERLGGTRTIKVNLRLIAATNHDLKKSVVENHFRSDLFYRLNVFPIRMPSLRERREDIPLLIRHFVRMFSTQMGRTIETIPEETMEALLSWHWPGNVRELENFIERSVILTTGTALAVPLNELRDDMRNGTESLAQTEREHIIRVLRETGGLLSGPGGAARRLGLKRTTLQSKMQRLGITSADYSSSEANG